MTHEAHIDYNHNSQWFTKHFPHRGPTHSYSLWRYLPRQKWPHHWGCINRQEGYICIVGILIVFLYCVIKYLRKKLFVYNKIICFLKILVYVLWCYHENLPYNFFWQYLGFGYLYTNIVFTEQQPNYPIWLQVHLKLSFAKWQWLTSLAIASDSCEPQ